MLRWLFIIFLIADGLVEVAIRSPKTELVLSGGLRSHHFLLD